MLQTISTISASQYLGTCFIFNYFLISLCRKTSRRTHILSSQRFLVFVLLVAVFDMLLATTELACDVLAETYGQYVQYSVYSQYSI